MTRRPSWPTSSGAALDRNTPVELAGGEVRWSVELGHRLATDVVADGERRWFARCPGEVVAGDARGVAWRRPAAVLAPAILDDGLVALSSDTELVAAQPATGDPAWSVPGHCTHATPRVGGGAAAVFWNGPQASLVSIDEGARVRWSRRVDAPVAAPLVLPGDTVVYVALDRISAFDGTGRALWDASPGGFDAVPATGRFTTQAVELAGGQILVGVTHDSFLGYAIVEPAAGTLRRWPADADRATPASPFGVRRHPAPLALLTWLQATMLVIPVDDSERRREPLPTPPVAFAIDPAGRIAVSYTLDAGELDRYAWHDPEHALRGRSGVALFDTGGARRWTWDAPGPLGGFAVGAAGEVLVTSEGRLWALA